MWPIGIASALYSLLSVVMVFKLLLFIRKSIKEWGLNLHIKSDVIFFLQLIIWKIKCGFILNLFSYGFCIWGFCSILWKKQKAEGSVTSARYQWLIFT